MYKVNWDIGNNGISLTDREVKPLYTRPPRPVFFEELDLLGFNSWWNYPKSEEPLLWFVDRKYFYKGESVAEIRGGNAFDEPHILLTDKGRSLNLQPIEIDKIVEVNKEAIFVIENEAMDFIEHTFKTYRSEQNKVDMFAASFSGGKDSQVILDLVSRIIPPDDYIVVYSDTYMELPSTYETLEETKSLYKSLYPELRFYIARNNKDTLEYWKKFGVPSRMHRWCCSVTKTAPFGRLLKTIHANGIQPQALVFEGVRAEESTQREHYNRIGKGVKHSTNINARPILYWNTAEVFLYIFYRNLPINKGYRNGLARVGCSVCPLASDWSEFILNKKYPELINRYFQVIEEQVEAIGIRDKRNYIKQGNWKKRSGGRGMINNSSRLDIISQRPDWEAILSNPKENIFEWIKVAGDIITKKTGHAYGEISVKNKIFKFSLEEKKIKDEVKLKLKICDIFKDPIFANKLKKILYKTTYCIHCESCEVECPSGALSVIPKVKIDINKCSHCGNCLDFSEKGCLMAKSISVYEGGIGVKTKTSGIDKYSGFGLREKWLKGYLNNIENWFESDNLLGSKQIPAVINWLRDAELLNRHDKKPGKTSLKLKNQFPENINLIWEIIWVNLYFNSAIARWYVEETDWGCTYSREDLLTILQDYFQNHRERTLKNALGALINTFDESPLGDILKIGFIEKKGRSISAVKKIGSDNVSPISIAYALYRFAFEKNRCRFTVSEFYKDNQKGGPYKLFGISKNKFENVLRALQENKNNIVRVELVADLDNISLKEEIDHIEILDLLLED